MGPVCVAGMTAKTADLPRCLGISNRTMAGLNNVPTSSKEGVRAAPGRATDRVVAADWAWTMFAAILTALLGESRRAIQSALARHLTWEPWCFPRGPFSLFRHRCVTPPLYFTAGSRTGSLTSSISPWPVRLRLSSASGSCLGQVHETAMACRRKTAALASVVLATSRSFESRWPWSPAKSPCPWVGHLPSWAPCRLASSALVWRHTSCDMRHESQGLTAGPAGRAQLGPGSALGQSTMPVGAGSVDLVPCIGAVILAASRGEGRLGCRLP